MLVQRFTAALTKQVIQFLKGNTGNQQQLRKRLEVSKKRLEEYIKSIETKKLQRQAQDSGSKTALDWMSSNIEKYLKRN